MQNVSGEIPARTAHGRIEYLDGLRGFAILMVIAYHAYARWPKLYVFGDRFVGNLLFDTDRAGVRLFFMISGFVILMTLENSLDLSSFLKRRWFRLFPAMLVCSTVIALTSVFLPERPAGPIYLLNFLPGLTFTGGAIDGNPLWADVASIFGLHSPESLEGSFWSLYVEVKFYIIFGCAYFYLGERNAIILIITLFLAGVACERIYQHSRFDKIEPDFLVAINQTQIFAAIHKVTHLLQSFEYGWFAAGAVFFKFIGRRELHLFAVASVVSLVSAKLAFGPPIGNLAVSLLFISAIASASVRTLLANPLFVFLGFVSYPLYLLHENMMVALSIDIGRISPDLPAILIPILPICIVVVLGWIVAKYIEPRAKLALRWVF